MDESRIIITYPNQKVITVKKTDSNRDHTYGIFNIEACSLAAQELSDKAFRLYIFLNLNQDGYTFALSPVKIEAKYGINEKRCRSAVKELIDKGYLIQKRNGTNRYTFFELPIRENDMTNNAANMPDNAVAPPISAGDIPIEDRQTHQNGTAHTPELGREIIQDNTNNTITNIDYITEDSTEYYIENEDEYFADNLGWNILDEEKLPF